MAWILPIGYTDTAGSWENEEDAYDGNPATAAISNTHYAGHWTGPLIFVFEPCRAEIFHCNMMIPGVPVEARFWGLRDGESVWWDPVLLAVGSNVIDLDLEAGVWEQFGVRLRSPLVNWGGGRVNDVRIFRPCTGPLRAICEIFHDIGDWFAGLADDISGVMFVGAALSAPFRSLAETFHDLGDTCCEASAKLQEILDTIEAGITPDTLLAIIQTHWPTLYNLITDPIGWFLVQLTLAFDLEPFHTRSLDALAKYILQEYFPALYQVWLDPQGWLADLLEENFPLLYYLVVDPAGELLYLIGQLFDLEPIEASSPERVVKALFEKYFPELYLLWRELSLLIAVLEKQGMVGLLKEIHKRFYDVAERTLRYFWEGVW